MNRMKEVKKILDNYTEKRTGLYIKYGNYSQVELGQADKELDEKTAYQICQPFPQPLDDKELREKLATVSGITLHKGLRLASDASPSCDFAHKYIEQIPPEIWEEICYAVADQILALLQPKIEEARRQGIIKLGKRLKKVRDESYDEQTFRADLNELTKLAVKGEILPEYVVKCVGVIFKNPKFNPKYAKPHQYEHSDGYPNNKHICVCGLKEADKMHIALKGGE